MKRHWLTLLLAGLAAFPVAAQTPPTAPEATNIPSGTPEGEMVRMQSHNSTGFPAPQEVEGQLY